MGPGSITRNSLRPYVNEREQPAIIIDSREQTPWPFAGLPQRIATLATGDYSLAGFESLLLSSESPKRMPMDASEQGVVGSLTALEDSLNSIERQLSLSAPWPPSLSRRPARVSTQGWLWDHTSPGAAPTESLCSGVKIETTQRESR